MITKMKALCYECNRHRLINISTVVYWTGRQEGKKGYLVDREAGEMKGIYRGVQEC